MNRRNFLQSMAIGTLAVGAPAASCATKTTMHSDVIGPILLERVCDHEKSRMSAAEWKEFAAQYPGHLGCGTRFRWYWGLVCICPNCGWTYLYTLNDLKNKVFVVDAHS